MSSQVKTKNLYIPPDEEQVEEYALNVCKHIWKQRGNKYFYHQEFIGEFTSFMKLAIKIQTKHLNKEETAQDGS